MILPDLWVYTNFFVCGLAAIRLMNYQRNGAQYKFFPSFMAWLLIVAFGSVPLRILTNDYSHADPSEVAINVAGFILVMLAGGNVTKIFRGAKSDSR
ncbi:phage holin family protein [Morganella morganii]|uniref:phage holin family protein n=2 Tax=Morganella morganii TaxID=582 RepID=UPI001BD9A6AD|nr:phage holin family protein [Morganella morganii]MBT0504623.1 phage holin family protein [Morganella morganii subsp. morganii]MDW7787239.1 phage holin family protein [Morganella morganii]QWM12322.1 phage holin family protein [Morganella morganii subsp. morganii]